MSGKTTNHFPVAIRLQPGFLVTPPYFLNQWDFSEFLDGCSIKSPSNGDSIWALPCRIIEIVLTQLPQPSWRSTACGKLIGRVFPRVMRVVRATSQSASPVKSRDLCAQHATIFEAAKPARWKQMLTLHQSHHFPSGTWI